jgi:hypothetical protein
MEVLSIRGNKVNCDFTMSEYDMLFKRGLQIWIDEKIGPNKIKVYPILSSDLSEASETSVKAQTKEEIKEEKKFSDELVSLAVNEAFRIKIEEKSSILCNHANEVPSKCECGTDCYCKSHTCKCAKDKKAKKAKK